MNVLVTGGAGYIGSHTCVELLEKGYGVVVIDNLVNSSAKSLERVEQITGKSLDFYQNDVRDRDAMERIFSKHDIDCVIHFAGLKAVGESVEKPLLYYDNNIAGTVTLLQAMKECGVNKLIFSSSSTVYGTPVSLPLTEDMPTGTPTNPYGRTKLMIEEILRDLCAAQPDFAAVCLRYFNPIGAHDSGLIGEDPNGIPNNLLPYVARVASGKLEYVRVFGDDYPTPDGTGVRDYIHVVDLARGHVDALTYAENHAGWEAINLGTGRGSSVLEVIAAFEKACGKKLPYKVLQRRAGDIAANWCCPDKAEKLLGWKAQYGIAEMCSSSWKFERMHTQAK